MNGTTNNGTNNQAVGAIEFTSARANAMTFGNSSTTANGVLTLNGTTVNSISNVILRNNSGQTLTIQDAVGSGNKTMGVALGNATNNVVVLDGTGNIAIASAISGSARKLTVQGSGSGDLVLSGTNTFTGGIDISGSGKLRLGAAAALPTTGNIAISGDGRLRFSAAGTYGASTQSITINPTGTTNPAIDLQTSNIAVTLNPDIALNADTRIESNGSTGSLTLAGKLSGSGLLVKQAGGNLILTSTSNTATGGTQIGNGTLTVNSGSSMGTGALTMFQTSTNNTALTLNNTTQSVGSLSSQFTAVTGTQTQVITLNGTTLTVNQSVDGTYGPGAVATLTSTIAGTGALTKAGSATLTLGNTNTYSGATRVNAGKLSIASTGSINSSSGVTIAGGEFNYNSSTALTPAVTFSGTGGKLTGSGTVSSAVTITSGNTLAPGNSIGTQTFGAGLTIAGTYSAELGTPGATPAAGVSDRAVVTGNLDLTGGTLTLVDNANANSQGSAGAGAYRLATFSGTRTGTFATVNNPLNATLHEVVSYTGTTNGSVDISLFRLAAATAPASTAALGNVRVGSALTGTASITNSASSDGFAEQLKATVTGSGSGSGTGFTGVAGGSSGTVNYSLATSSAGAKSGSASVSLLSTGVGTYSDTPLSTTSVSLSGNAYDLANPQVTSSSTIAFGNVHVGASNPTGTVSVANTTITNASFQDSLNASASTDNAKVTGNSFSAQAAGTTGSLTLTANAATAGSLASSVTLGYTSNANGVSGLSNQALASGSVTTTGQVYSGQSTWTGTGGVGSWGTLASGFGTNWGANQGSPGLDSSFKGVDTATFAVPSTTNIIQLNGANPNLNQLNLSAGSYNIVGGSGGGSITLSGAGSTIVSSSTQAIGVPVVLGADATISSSGTLDLHGGVVKDGRTLTFTGGGQISITGLSGISGSSANSDLVVDNVTVIVGASSSYNGPTTVQNSGTLVANAAISTNSVTVNANSKLSGTSSVSATTGSVFINGTLQIGDSTVVTPTASSFSVSSTAGGSTVLGATSILKIDLFLGAGSGNNSGSPVASDLLAISGDWTINSGAKLNIASTMTGWAANDEWHIFDLTALGVRTGAFDLADISAPALNPGLVWDYSRIYTDGNIFVASVPEPGRALLLFAGLAAIIGRRQRK